MHLCDVCGHEALDRTTMRKVLDMPTRYGGVMVCITFVRPAAATNPSAPMVPALAQLHLCDKCRREAVERAARMIDAEARPQ